MIQKEYVEVPELKGIMSKELKVPRFDTHPYLGIAFDLRTTSFSLRMMPQLKMFE